MIDPKEFEALASQVEEAQQEEGQQTVHLSGDRAIAYRRMMEATSDAAEALRRVASECRKAHGLE